MSGNTRKVSARVLEVVAFLADGDMEDMRDVAKLFAERAPARAIAFGLIIANTPQALRGAAVLGSALNSGAEAFAGFMRGR